MAIVSRDSKNQAGGGIILRKFGFALTVLATCLLCTMAVLPWHTQAKLGIRYIPLGEKTSLATSPQAKAFLESIRPLSAAHAPAASRATVLGTSTVSVSTPYLAPDLVTQSSLNAQLSAWFLALNDPPIYTPSYVDNPAVAAGGNYQGSGTTINNYSISQRIDKLDGVTITNSSINGVSDLSNIGATDGIGAWFTPGSIGNSTSTLLHFTAGFISLASSTITNLSAVNSTSTNATSTNHYASSLIAGNSTSTTFAITSVTSSLLKTLSSGAVVAAVAGVDYAAAGSSAAFPFTPTLNYAVNTSATSTPLWAQAGIFASSTSHFADADFGNATGTTFFSAVASSTNLFTSLFNAGGGALVVTASGSVGAGTTTPFRKFSVADTVASPQVAIAYDATRYAQLQVDSVGDLTLSAQGGDVYLTNENFFACTSGCPSGSPTGTGNILAENKLGIGTTTPASKLTIETQDASTDLFQVASSTAQSIFGIFANGRVGVATSTPWKNFSISGDGVLTGTWYLPQGISSIIPTTCPTGMIPVPGSAADGQQGFCVDKYEVKGATTSPPVSSAAAGAPLVSITQPNARAACIVAGKHLITEKEWLTIAHNVENVGWNWNGGVAGTNQMSDGHSDNVSASALVADITGNADDDPCVNTGQTCSLTTWDTQRRTYQLSNGEYIWDFGGNVWEWVDQVVSDDYPILNSPTAGWQACSTSGDGICGNTRTTNDQWYRGGTTATRGFFRGGSWADGALDGAFTLALNFAPSDVRTGLGFRCAR